MLVEISKRKLESYKRAEAVAQELRRQVSGHRDDIDMNVLADFVIHWMRTTGSVKFHVPKKPKL
jgi:hypothetical protein